MRCPFAHEDAAYVLGALAPADRLEFEQHLPGCKECTRAVRGLAGLPGLLSRIDPEVLAATSAEQPASTVAAVTGPPPVPVPDTVLPRLVRAARTARRRRVALAAAAAAAAAAVVTSVVATQLPGQDGAAPPSAGDSSTPEGETPMAPVGDVPVEAALALEAVTWGTRLELTCTYDTALVRYQLPPSVDYVIVVRTRDGQSERVGSWRSVNGRTMRLTAGTAATTGEITAVQVLTPDGRVVLTSTA